MTESCNPTPWIEWTLDNPIETSTVKRFISDTGEEMVCVKKSFTSMDGKKIPDEEIIQTAALYESNRQRGEILWGIAISKNADGDFVNREFDDFNALDTILAKQS